jgi:hypothetical protein
MTCNWFAMNHVKPQLASKTRWPVAIAMMGYVQSHILQDPGAAENCKLSTALRPVLRSVTRQPNDRTNLRMLERRLQKPVTNVSLQSNIVERRANSNHCFSDHFPLFVNSSNAEKSPSSIFFQTASIRALRSRPVSRFFLLFFPRSLDKHLLTSRFMSLQPPKTL